MPRNSKTSHNTALTMRRADRAAQRSVIENMCKFLSKASEPKNRRLMYGFL